MKLYKLILIIVISNVLLGLTSLFVLDKITADSNIVNNKDGIVTIIPSDIKIEKPVLSEIKYPENVNIDNQIIYNNSVIAYGSMDNHPYIHVYNEEDKEIIIKDENIEGTITNVINKDYFITAEITDKEVVTNVDYFIGLDEIIPFHKKQININYTKGVVVKPEYLVIHETANRNIGADANAHYRYWSTNPTANASTHFVVDSKEIYQMLDLSNMAWHVGDNRGYSEIYNTNSLGIEIAVNADGDYMLARKYTIALSALIMRSLDMEINQLVRHYDASGKDCPYYMLAQPELWIDFVNQVEALL